MPQTISRFLIVLSLTSAFAAPTFAGPKPPHFDIWLRVVDANMVTGSISEGTPGKPLDEFVRVFAADLGEDPEFPFAATEPGFQSLPGRDTAGAIFSFDIPGQLLAWTGSTLVPNASTFTIAFGPASVTSSSGPVEGFSFAAQRSGLLHDHFDFTLNGMGGADPEPGVFVLPLTFAGEAPVYAPSPTLWLVFNNGQSEEEHDAVIQYSSLFLACGIDLTTDGVVDAGDIGVLLGAWGTDNAAADLTGDGLVGADDLALLLGAWGFKCGD
ncbi:MAG: GC-type dockerin domain-anchored protein [Phycisphaerae bacterium]|nr:GC-type dockerin domain-anchored protein [Phycisphaerae bacterium]